MKFNIVVVPPDGGEANFSAPIKGNRIPQKGEYIQLTEEDGTSYFLVRNIISCFEEDDSSVKDFSETGIHVEVEPLDYEMQSPSQQRMIERYKTEGYTVKQYIPSGY
ncbi:MULTISPECIES: hypothetical protein [unclassified Peribacillus]|uniref:hypothetical protein n=1 Tax=unclassified Peribacillus TaxID=2675266 RepID=UPI001913E957|nr:MULTISPECIES: hypothetical protein [unclassified Peribacillus]MBK5446090.1 hypothetical protein [Peribacillus sp. TH24]MBK5497386.1 hypothetical protein [Peribacillus sp. TH14]WMX57473.1 hypothetical protein RE409_09755 [Peribacillus sp. R9-11]